MAVITGKNGAAANGSAIAQVVGWTLNDEIGDGAFVSSNTGGYEDRVPGPGKWSGTLRTKYDTAPPLGVGQTANLTLTIDSGGTNDAYVGNAMILSVGINVDLSSNVPVEYEFAFGGKGNLTTRPT